MGKKSLRRARSAKDRKPDQNPDQKQKLQFDRTVELFLGNILEVLHTRVPVSPNDTTGSFFIRVVKLWRDDILKDIRAVGKPEGSRFPVMSALGMISLLHMRNGIFLELCQERILQLLDDGLVDLGKMLMITSHLLVSFPWDINSIQSIPARMDKLIEIIQTHEDKEKGLPDRSLPLLFLEDKILERVGIMYYFTSSRIRMVQWMLTSWMFRGNTLRRYEFQGACPIKINFNFINTESGSNAEREICVNPTVQFKTLMWLVQHELKSKPTDYKIALNDKFGLSKGAILMKHSGDKTLQHIGFENNDVLSVAAKNVDFGNMKGSSSDTAASTQAKKDKKSSGRNAEKECKQNTSDGNTTSSCKNAIKSSPCISSKKQGPCIQPTYGSDEDKDKRNHYKLLSLVFAEASQIFHERRQKLNALAMKRQPKKRSAKEKPKEAAPEPANHCCVLAPRGKAGKVSFPVLIGHEEYLYRTSKSTRQTQVRVRSLDLHGCTKDEAIHKLNNSLPVWKEEAVKEFSCTVSWNIIVGGGNQFLEEAVRQWIRENRCAANRFV